MSRQYHSSNRGSFTAAIILVAITWKYWSYAKYILIGLLAVIGVVVAKRVYKSVKYHFRSLQLEDIDSMDGLSFEYYVAGLLQNNGFSNVLLTEQYDMGIDIVAEKNEIRWGIQVKRHSGLVKAIAIRQVVTALRFYGCDQAMVITNSTYSKVARELADSNECVLIDRDGLVSLMLKTK